MCSNSLRLACVAGRRWKARNICKKKEGGGLDKAERGILRSWGVKYPQRGEMGIGGEISASRRGITPYHYGDGDMERLCVSVEYHQRLCIEY